MFNQTSIGGHTGVSFDERTGSLRRNDLEARVRPVWEANNLPVNRSWHEFTKADLEKMADTLGVLGDAQPRNIPDGAFVVSAEDVENERSAKRDEILLMKHFAFLSLAKKFNVHVPEPLGKEEKAGIVESILDKISDS